MQIKRLVTLAGRTPKCYAVFAYAPASTTFLR